MLPTTWYPYSWFLACLLARHRARFPGLPARIIHILSSSTHFILQISSRHQHPPSTFRLLDLAASPDVIMLLLSCIPSCGHSSGLLVGFMICIRYFSAVSSNLLTTSLYLVCLTMVSWYLVLPDPTIRPYLHDVLWHSVRSPRGSTGIRLKFCTPPLSLALPPIKTKLTPMTSFGTPSGHPVGLQVSDLSFVPRRSHLRYHRSKLS